MRRIGVVLIAILCCGPILAEDLTSTKASYRHEVQFKLGPAPTVSLFWFFWTFDYTNPWGPPGMIGFLAVPAFSAEYLYNVTPRHAIGCSVNIFLVLPTALFKYRFTYGQTKTVRMYGAVGVGFGNYSLALYPAIQLTPFGVQFGGGKGFFMMETGVGMEGSLLILGGGFRF